MNRLRDAMSLRFKREISDEEILHTCRAVSQYLEIPVKDLVSNLLLCLKYNFSHVKPGIIDVSTLYGGRITKEEFLIAYTQDMIYYQDQNALIDTVFMYTNTFRVMTYNVHYWTSPRAEISNYSSVRKIIDELRPGLVLLQEAVAPENNKDCVSLCYGQRIDNFYKRFNDQGLCFSHFAPASSFMCGENSKYGNLTLSNIPLSSCLSRRLSSTVENRSFGICDLFFPGFSQPITVVNTHLDVYDTTGKTRRVQIKTILRTLKELGLKDKPTLLCGDLNCLNETDYNEEEKMWLGGNSSGEPDFSTIELLKRNDFQDVFERKNLKFTCWTGRRVDYIFTRNFPSFISVGECYTYYSPNSDHIPLIVDFEIF